MAEGTIERVTGLVQGVYYRASTKERARVLGLTGWVRNLADGSVELEAQGHPDGVAALIQWCRQGPPGAAVAEVQVTRGMRLEAGEAEFRVRR